MRPGDGYTWSRQVPWTLKRCLMRYLLLQTIWPLRWGRGGRKQRPKSKLESLLQLVFRAKLTQHTAFERTDNTEPAAVTALAISKWDHTPSYLTILVSHLMLFQREIIFIFDNFSPKCLLYLLTLNMVHIQRPSNIVCRRWTRQSVQLGGRDKARWNHNDYKGVESTLHCWCHWWWLMVMMKMEAVFNWVVRTRPGDLVISQLYMTWHDISKHIMFIWWWGKSQVEPLWFVDFIVGG